MNDFAGSTPAEEAGTDTGADSPLLGAGSPLDDRQRAVIARVTAAERAGILALPGDDPLDPRRRRRVEATRDEMFGQPEAIEQTWVDNRHELDRLAARLAAADINRAFLVGAGDSLAVMIAARRSLELTLGVPCEPVQSLEFAYYQQHLVNPRSLVIALSSSGETTRTVEAALVAQHAGAITVAITNTPGSSLATECQQTLLVRATRVGWPTQSSTAALALLLDLAARIGSANGLAQTGRTAADLADLPALMAGVLADCDGQIAEIAAAESTHGMYLFSAGGPTWPAAIVGAAKVKECTPDHAVEIQVEEYHHYNSQKAGEPLFLLAPTGPTVPRAMDTGRDARRFGGRLYVCTTVAEHRLDEHAERTLHLPAVDEAFAPLLYLLPAQMIGYHLGMAKFADAEAGRHD